jgi:hypothetical protein
VIKTAWYWYSDRQVDQWNRTEDPEMNSHTYGHLIFDKGAKTIQWKKDRIFNNWCWHNWQLSCRRMRIDPFLSPCTKVKSKWIKELHIKPETLKLIEEKVGKNLEDMGTGEIFLNRTAMAVQNRQMGPYKTTKHSTLSFFPPSFFSIVLIQYQLFGILYNVHLSSVSTVNNLTITDLP